jgi:hypothetical protein
MITQLRPKNKDANNLFFLIHLHHIVVIAPGFSDIGISQSPGKPEQQKRTWKLRNE